MRAMGQALSLVAVVVLVAACGSSSGNNSGSSSSTKPAGSTTAAAAQSTFGSVQLSSCPSSSMAKITGDTISLGTSAPLSGPYAVVGSGVKLAQAYFNHLNQQGGIPTVEGKKKLSLTALDDQYDPARAAANARQLVEQHHVAAVVDMVGTPTAEAAEPYLNEQCIPQMFPESGSSKATLNPAHPFTSQVFTYVQEGDVIGQYIKAKYPNEKVVMLLQNDEVGQGILQGVEHEGIKPAVQQSYEPTDTSVTSQMTTLAATKAPLFVDASFSVMCSQSLKDLNSDGWHPKIFLGTSCGATDVAAASAGAAAGGIWEATYLKPTIGTAADQKLFATLSKDAGQPPNPISQVAYISMELVVDAIEHAKTLSPVGIAEAATQLPSTALGMFAPGVTFGDGVAKPVVANYVVWPYSTSAKQFEGTGPTYVASDY